jgi:hypothetical protein
MGIPSMKVHYVLETFSTDESDLTRVDDGKPPNAKPKVV